MVSTESGSDLQRGGLKAAGSALREGLTYLRIVATHARPTLSYIRTGAHG